jgi:hypothetical protein
MLYANHLHALCKPFICLMQTIFMLCANQYLYMIILLETKGSVDILSLIGSEEASWKCV